MPEMNMTQNKTNLFDGERLAQLKRSASTSRKVNLKYENLQNHNPFAANNWSTGNTNSLRSKQISSNFQSIANTNLVISNYLDTQSNASKNKYSVPPVKTASVYGLNIIKSDIQSKSPRDAKNENDRTKPNQHPILNNGFLKPKVVPNNHSVTTSLTKSEFFNTSSSSLSNVKNTNLPPKRVKSTNGFQPTNNAHNSTTSINSMSMDAGARIDTLLGSKNARDAFFERLRVTEYLKQANKNEANSRPSSGRPSSGKSNSSSEHKAKVYDLKKMQYIANYTESLLDNDSMSSAQSGLSQLNSQLNNNPSQQSSSTNMFNKPYNVKNNFSNVIKIDKKFKKGELNVDHAYFYTSQNQFFRSNMSAKPSSTNLVEETEQNKTYENEIVSTAAATSIATQKTLSDDSTQNGQKVYSEKLNQHVEKDIMKLCNDLKSSSMNTSKLHRERITNLLNRRNTAKQAESLTPKNTAFTTKIEATYDIDRNVIELRPTTPGYSDRLELENDNKGNETNAQTLYNNNLASTPGSASSNSILSSSSASVTGFASPKRSTSSSNKTSKSSISNETSLTQKQVKISIPNKAIPQTPKLINENRPIEKKGFSKSSQQSKTTGKTVSTADPNEDEDDCRGFSDDELDGAVKDKRSLTSLSQKTTGSKISMTMDNSSESEDDSSIEYDDDEDIRESNETLAEVLQKNGFNAKRLLGVNILRDDNGESYTTYNPPLIASLFDNVPPCINFLTQDEKMSEMPASLKKLLKWKMCSITPNIVRSTIARSNFGLSSQKYDWIGVWGSHMKPESFKCLKEYQKFNHLPGSFQIGRKDRLCRNLCHAQAVHGKAAYNFVPMTFVLPFDLNLLKTEFETKNCKWILKPPASARGQGIRLLNKMDQVPKKRACVVQKYLSNPHLIDDLKYDLRIYVYVSSYDPLRIYLFNDGLTRFASRKYSNSVKTINDKFMHLTNYSINKTNKDYKQNDNENACYGHKWSLAALWTYLKKKGINTDKIWDNITDLIIKTIICGDPHVNVQVKTHVKRKYSVHELFGFDIILDENLKPWIVEVNISPSLNSSSPLDVSVKGQMIADLLRIAGYMIPDPKELAKMEGKKTFKKLPKSLHFNKKILSQNLTNDEKSKHQYYIQRHADEKVISTIFDILTPDDIRMLVETEDEFNRRGNFTRIFPSYNSRNYLKYFDTIRYYNILLIEWINKWKTSPEKGISLLNNYCKKKIHLQNPTSSQENQWSLQKIFKYTDLAKPNY